MHTGASLKACASASAEAITDVSINARICTCAPAGTNASAYTSGDVSPCARINASAYDSTEASTDASINAGACAGSAVTFSRPA